jgi:hypothetical protein
VVGVAEVERQLRQIPRAAGETIGGDPRAKLLDIAPQADSRRLAKDTRQMERGASEGAGKLTQSRGRLEAFVDRKAGGFDEVAPPAPDIGGRRLRSRGPRPEDGAYRLVGQLGERVIQGQGRIALPDEGQQLEMEARDAG